MKKIQIRLFLPSTHLFCHIKTHEGTSSSVQYIENDIFHRDPNKENAHSHSADTEPKKACGTGVSK